MKMAQHLVIFCLTLLRRGDTIFRIIDIYEGYQDNGEFILKNYGLIQAQNVQFILPAADEYLRIEIQGDVTNKTILAAHEERRISYRVTCLSALDAQGGGGCYTWWTCLRMPYEYITSCGITNSEERSFCFSRVYGSCPGGGGWRQYDQSGKLQQYGRADNVIAGMIYDQTNNLIVGVYDRNTNQVMWIERNSNGLPVSVSDSAGGGRSVKYGYDGAGILTNHIDVLGERHGQFF